MANLRRGSLTQGLDMDRRAVSNIQLVRRVRLTEGKKVLSGEINIGGAEFSLKVLGQAGRAA